MNKSLTQVAEFHDIFNHPIGNLETPESLKTRQLRIKLLFEELAELAEASDCQRTLIDITSKHAFRVLDTIGGGVELDEEEFIEQVSETHDAHNIQDGDNVNKLEELDALCDIQYVLNGKIITAGLHHVFDKNFDVVHANNMNKAHRDKEHILETISKKTDLGEWTVVEKDGKFLLLNGDGKLIKPHDHVKVKLTL